MKWPAFTYLCHMLLGCLVLLLLATGCDPVFEPLNESEPFGFSINGLLDVTADTQWIRVSEIRKSVRVPDNPSPPDAMVTLENVETGHTVTLQDTLLSFRGNSTEGGSDTYNFYTTMPVTTEQTYLLTVTGSDGRVNTATVRTPPDYPEPVFRGNDLNFDVEELAILADVSIVFYLRNDVTGEIQKIKRPKIEKLVEFGRDNYRIRLGNDFLHDYRFLADYLSSAPGVETPWRAIVTEVYVAYAGPGWPPFLLMSDYQQQVPNAASNVDGGLGFVGGIISHHIPLCVAPPGRFYPCPEV